jgi:polar amino acid transport system permease protein
MSNEGAARMIRQFGTAEAWFIIAAVRWTLLLSAIAFTGGGIAGLIVALARTAPPAWMRHAAAGYIHLFQGTPLLMQLFLVFFGSTVLGAGIDPLTAAAIALTLNAAAFLGEIWRGCIQAIPGGQWEAATALGMRHLARMRYVVLPQAGKIAIAPTVGFLVLLVKSTSLASIIGFVEITRAGQIINNVTFQPFLVFGVVATLYFLLCWPLSRLSQKLEQRFGTVRR